MRIVALILFASALHAQSAEEIVRKSVARDQSNWRSMRDYTWTILESERQRNADGTLKSEQSKQWETVILDGQPHHRHLAKNGVPLSPAEQQKQQKELDAALAKLKRESPAQRKRRIANQEKQREKSREFLREIPNIFDFEMQGEDTVDGRPVWVIGAKPKTDYQPKDREARILQKMAGKLWIDQTEYQWVRVEAETTDSISFGLFLARVAPGAKLLFEQMRVNDELWLPKHAVVSGAARLILLKNLSMEQEIVWSDYKKFQVDSKIVDTPAPR